MKIRVFLISFFLSLPFWWAINLFQKNLENYFYAQISQPFQKISEIKIPEKPNLELQARAAISVKIRETGKQKILFKKNINQPLPIASLTKLMTGIIVLENYDLENTLITISKTAANQENVPNYGNLDKEVGKKFNVKQLLDLMLIYSSNDAAWALAEVIGRHPPTTLPAESGAPENFVEKMNQKAEDLGLENTNFLNPHGLDPDEIRYSPETLNYFNYSTARKLVKIAQYILKEHPLIFEISKKEPFYLIEDGIFDLFLTQEIVGGKTGDTDEAGGCILFIFRNERGSFFINLILGAPSASIRIEEMQKLIDWLIP